MGVSIKSPLLSCLAVLNGSAKLKLHKLPAPGSLSLINQISPFQLIFSGILHHSYICLVNNLFLIYEFYVFLPDNACKLNNGKKMLTFRYKYDI